MLLISAIIDFVSKAALISNCDALFGSISLLDPPPINSSASVSKISLGTIIVIQCHHSVSVSYTHLRAHET